jgi:hypothetical protein
VVGVGETKGVIAATVKANTRGQRTSDMRRHEIGVLQWLEIQTESALRCRQRGPYACVDLHVMVCPRVLLLLHEWYRRWMRRGVGERGAAHRATSRAQRRRQRATSVHRDRRGERVRSAPLEGCYSSVPSACLPAGVRLRSDLPPLLRIESLRECRAVDRCRTEFQSPVRMPTDQARARRVGEGYSDAASSGCRRRRGQEAPGATSPSLAARHPESNALTQRRNAFTENSIISCSCCDYYLRAEQV